MKSIGPNKWLNNSKFIWTSPSHVGLLPNWIRTNNYRKSQSVQVGKRIKIIAAPVQQKVLQIMGPNSRSSWWVEWWGPGEFLEYNDLVHLTRTRTCELEAYVVRVSRFQWLVKNITGWKKKEKKKKLNGQWMGREVPFLDMFNVTHPNDPYPGGGITCMKPHFGTFTCTWGGPWMLAQIIWDYP